MKRLTTMTLVMLFWCVAVPVGRAQWGWAPPGYGVTGMRPCDGYHYRGLCQVLRDRRCRCSSCNPSPGATPGPTPIGTLPNSEDSTLHQPAPVGK